MLIQKVNWTRNQTSTANWEAELKHIFQGILLLRSLKEACENATLFRFLLLLWGSSSGWLPNAMNFKSQPLADC